MTTQTMHIIRKHVDRYVTTDSCHLHGIGLSVCRVCTLPSIQGRPVKGRHAAEGDLGYVVSTGFPRAARF